MIFQPVYHPFERVVRENGRRLVVSQLALRGGRYELDLDDFRQKVQSQNVRLCLFCSPHNPVGRVWTCDELEAFAKVCLENDVAIVSDEIHVDFVYPGYRHIPLEMVDKALSEYLVICTAPTKTFNLAGLQAANLVVSNRNLKRAIVRECGATGYSELGLAPEELDRLFLGRARVFLHNGRTFGAGGEGFMRMNIACPRPVLQEALERMAGAISS